MYAYIHICLYDYNVVTIVMKEVFTCIFIHTCSHTHTYRYASYIHTRVYTYMYVCAHTYTYMHVYIHAHTHTQIDPHPTYTHMVYICTHVYIHAYIHLLQVRGARVLQSLIYKNGCERIQRFHERVNNNSDVFPLRIVPNSTGFEVVDVERNVTVCAWAKGRERYDIMKCPSCEVKLRCVCVGVGVGVYESKLRCVCVCV